MRDVDTEGSPDEVLVAEFVATGDHRPLELLLARHEDRIYGMAYRVLGNRADALDAVQEVFLTVFRKAGSFRHQSAFTTWLYRLTANACSDVSRRRARAPAPVEDLPDRVPDRSADPDTRLWIEQALGKLPLKQRVPVVMRDLYGMSYEEIATATRVSQGTVKSRIARGRARLGELLGTEPAARPDRLSGTE